MEKGKIELGLVKRNKIGQPVGRITIGGNSTSHMANRLLTEQTKLLRQKRLDAKAIEYEVFGGVE